MRAIGGRGDVKARLGLRDAPDFSDLLEGHAEALGDLAFGPAQTVDGVDNGYWQPDGPALVGDDAGYGLADPLGGVGGEPEAPVGVGLLGGPDKVHVPLLDQILELQAPTRPVNKGSSWLRLVTTVIVGLALAESAAPGSRSQEILM